MTPLRLEHRPLHNQLIMQNIKKFNQSESFISWKGRTLVRFLKHYTLCKTVLLNIDSLQSRVYFAQGFSYAIYMRNASETREMRACEHSGSRQILSYDRSLKVRVCEIPTHRRQSAPQGRLYASTALHPPYEITAAAVNLRLAAVTGCPSFSSAEPTS